MFYEITRSILRKVIKTPVDEIRSKLIKWDTKCEDTMVYYRMQTKVLREIYAENLVLREHPFASETGFIGWEPEVELGETYENVESTWKYEDVDDDDDGLDEFWTEEGWEELKKVEEI